MKKISIWIGLSILMMILWGGGLMIGNLVFPSSLMEMETDSNAAAGFIFFLVSALNAGIILQLIYKARYRGWELAGYVFLVSFGIQYFMSQIETVWFNDSLGLPGNGIAAIVLGGACTLAAFSVIATWITGKFKSKPDKSDDGVPHKFSIKRILFLSAVIWPLIYFAFGYFVAWQFEDVRLLYSGTTEMDSFVEIMKGNFQSGLYLFQILRGFLWILIGILVLKMARGNKISNGVLLGLLFTILGSSGLLLPNPIMPEMVRIAHLIETSTSDFIWGFIIVWTLWRPVAGTEVENN
ncbi:hypothetical protein [Muriicola sp. Z0-33]|uniref:hypothetical protein n=1 Tax=Muriicola sp. Z0-33 TaxID=2816957 RepID=UPI00223787F5|nr:hypothetical protein [Muriicola sp. Z0-33]MCW5514747.1 hypothetical protein [Muriicola sp. Z0-33]